MTCIAQELVLRYEALSLAVAQLHMQSQAESPMPAAALSSAQASQRSAPAAAQQQDPRAAGSGRDSPHHLLASRQPVKAHEPMFGAAQPQAEGAAAPGASALLQVWLTRSSPPCTPPRATEELKLVIIPVGLSWCL